MTCDKVSKLLQVAQPLLCLVSIRRKTDRFSFR